MLQRGETDAARRAFESIIADDPGRHEAMYMLGAMARESRDDAAAERWFRRARGVEPGQPEYARQLGRVLDRLDRIDEAMDEFVAARALDPRPGESALAIADETRRLVEASVRDLTPWTIASWPPAPPYLAVSRPPAFVVGSPRAGTRLVRAIADDPGRLCWIEERPCLARLREHLQRHAEGVDRVPIYLGQIDETIIRLLRALYFREAEVHVTDPAARDKRLVDRNPMNLAHLPIVRRVFPDAPVVVCLRDPRDAVLSAFMNAAPSPVAAAQGATLERAAEFHAAVVGQWLHLRDTLGLVSIEVRFEDMVRAPADERARLTTFLAGSGPMSSETSAATPVDIARSIGRWRRFRRHMAGALEILRPIVHRLGYQPE